MRGYFVLHPALKQHDLTRTGLKINLQPTRRAGHEQRSTRIFNSQRTRTLGNTNIVGSTHDGIRMEMERVIAPGRHEIRPKRREPQFASGKNHSDSTGEGPGFPVQVPLEFIKNTELLVQIGEGSIRGISPGIMLPAPAHTDPIDLRKFPDRLFQERSRSSGKREPFVLHPGFEVRLHLILRGGISCVIASSNPFLNFAQYSFALVGFEVGSSSVIVGIPMSLPV